MEQVTSRSSLAELRHARERVLHWDDGAGKEGALRALNEWIAERETERAVRAAWVEDEKSERSLDLASRTPN